MLAGVLALLIAMAGCGSLDGAPVDQPPTDTPPSDGSMAVVGFSLVNADTDEPIAGFDPIVEGATLDLEQLPTRNLNIRVRTDPPVVGSVVVRVVGDNGHSLQHTPPYVLFSDGGSGAGLIPEPGAYHISATPYSASGGQGSAGEPLNLSFRVGSVQSPPGGPEVPEVPEEPEVPEVPEEPEDFDEPEAPVGASLAVQIGGSPIGRSIQHIGANADVFNNDSFNIDDIRDLGLTSYRYFGGMEEFEPVDDNGIYGWPSRAEMRQVLSADPTRANEFVNWAAFDRNMAAYGNMLRQLYTIPGMQPIGMLRNSSNRSNFWIPRMNVTGSSCTAPDGSRIVWPEFSEADWNEWWQHVFAVVYWINVRNGAEMRVDRWSVHNEPNHHPEQGWCGTKEQYLEFIKYTSDAIDFVYETYLNDRLRWVHGGVLAMTNRAEWLRPMFRYGSGSSFLDRDYYQPSMFNVIDIHPFFLSARGGVRDVRALSRESGVPAYVRDYPIWLTEWGAWGARSIDIWDQVPGIIDFIIDNLIVMSTPGDNYAEGAIFWRMYDDDNLPYTNGLVQSDGTRRAGFYALRLAIMALNGGKEVLPTQLSSGAQGVMAITTREADGRYNLLMTNRSETAARDVQLDVSALLASGKAEVYRFDDARRGPESIERLLLLELSGGQTRFNLPPQSVVLVRVRP